MGSDYPTGPSSSVPTLRAKPSNATIARCSSSRVAAKQDNSPGDRAFDYLLGHAERNNAPPVENQIWAVLLHHITPYVLPSIAQAADRHRRTDVADLLISRASPVDGALLRAGRGDISALATLADGNRYAALRFARLLAERGDINTLTVRADHGDHLATVQLASLLAERGDIEALATGANRGDGKAAVQLAWLLARRGNVEQLLAHADRGDRDATWRLASLFAERGDINALTIRTDNGDEFAPAQLARLLIERGDLDALTNRADNGDQDAADQLARLLVERGDAGTLTTRADNGDRHAAWQLALMLTAGGDVDTLRTTLRHSVINSVSCRSPSGTRGCSGSRVAGLGLPRGLRTGRDGHDCVTKKVASNRWSCRVEGLTVRGRCRVRGLQERVGSGP